MSAAAAASVPSFRRPKFDGERWNEISPPPSFDPARNKRNGAKKELFVAEFMHSPKRSEEGRSVELTAAASLS